MAETDLRETLKEGMKLIDSITEDCIIIERLTIKQVRDIDTFMSNVRKLLQETE